MYIYTPREKFLQIYPELDLRKYFDFIQENSLDKSIKFETANHHILPKWAFPEYQKFSEFTWNKAILTHKNHLIAHFILWDMWKVSSNASPLLVMCSKKDRESWTTEGILNFSDTYQLACRKHAEAVSSKHKNKVVSQESIQKSKQTRIMNGTDKTGTYNCIDLMTGNHVHITSAEYQAGKDVLYQSFVKNIPSISKGVAREDHKGMLCVTLKGTNNKIYVACEEYKNNKKLYIHQSTGSTRKKGLVPVYNINTGLIERISTDEYNHNKDKFRHPASKLIWFNDGITNKRIKATDEIPSGFIAGRLKSDTTGRKMNVVTCPYCNKSGGSGNMLRYHFDKCKLFTTLIHQPQT